MLQNCKLWPKNQTIGTECFDFMFSTVKFDRFILHWLPMNSCCALCNIAHSCDQRFPNGNANDRQQFHDTYLYINMYFINKICRKKKPTKEYNKCDKMMTANRGTKRVELMYSKKCEEKEKCYNNNKCLISFANNTNRVARETARETVGAIQTETANKIARI